MLNDVVSRFGYKTCVFGLFTSSWGSSSWGTGVFIVALCADINNGVGTQVTSMESVYAGFSKFLRPLDDRFPASFSQLSIFSALRGLTTMKKTLDTARVMRLLQLSDEQLETVHTKDQMLKFRDEVLLNLERKKDNVDLGVAVDRVDRVDMDNATEESVSTVDTKALAKSGLESSCGTLSPSICVDDVEDEKMNNGLQVNEGSINRLRKLKKRKKKEEKCLERSTCSVTSTSKGDNSRSEGVMEGKIRSESVGKGHGIFSTSVSSSNDQLSNVMVGSEKKNKKQRSQDLISASFDSHVSFTGQKNPKKRRRSSFGEITCRDSSAKKILKKKTKRRSQDLIFPSLDRLDDFPSLQSHVSFARNSPKIPGKRKRGGFGEIVCGEISSEKIVKEKKKRHSQNVF
uniref:Uncharacterized protein n=1 Tax=Angiostrongylus cantonensis TaxID=6313 RepID=A0A0K0D2U3_ANGCA